ncbi:hypothetical protein A3K64_02205 [Candidatus Micrarchaeota archaeon RBG_16_36_9]|nr:MAG: hypothetical protein A3K64_02205 [Candidatus Micrarchaeota archaeon RBG_16_36_9]
MAKIVIKKFDILSVAKLHGLIGAIIGFVLGLFIAIFAGIAGAFASALGSAGGFGIAGFGILAIIVAPIMYGLIGFIGGAVGAFLYNIVADKIGGVSFES